MKIFLDVILAFVAVLILATLAYMLTNRYYSYRSTPYYSVQPIQITPPIYYVPR